MKTACRCTRTGPNAGFGTVVALLLLGTRCLGQTDDWPQFRGPGGQAVAESARPPVVFGPHTNQIWKTAVPPGNSSPIVTGSRLVITAGDTNRLEMICLDRATGAVLWRKGDATGRLGPEEFSENLAGPTPVTDGQWVYVYFGQTGVIAYDLEGHEQWRQTNAITRVNFGNSTSPILIGDKLVVVCDRDEGSFVEALDRKTGRILWKTERPRFRKGYATPFHWVHAQREELIVPGSLWLVAYDPATGRENWRYGGTSRVAWSTPSADAERLYYASTDSVDNRHARDEETPVPDDGGLLHGFDLTELVERHVKPGRAVLAIRSGGSGDITDTHLRWKIARGLPGVSSPVLYRHRLFTVKDGGFLSAYDAATGRVLYQDERIPAPGDYYASAVAADGRIYFISQSGLVTVIVADADSPRILAQNPLEEQTLATPALSGDSIFIRTAKALHRFGPVSKPSSIRVKSE
jgi:outer membrane protein assembly factor BamB